MKNSNSFFRLCAAALALLVASFATPADAATRAGATEGKAVVVKVVGNASYVDSKGGDGAIREGMTLRQGTSIITGSGASVTLDLGQNGDLLTINENSTASLDTLLLQDTGAEKAANTEVDAKRGSVSFNVKKLSAASKYEIKTANGVAGIRGSRGVVYAVGIYQCVDGTMLVRIRNLNTGALQTFTVTRANSLDASRGAAAPLQLTPIPPAQFERMDKELVLQTRVRIPVASEQTGHQQDQKKRDERNNLTPQDRITTVPQNIQGANRNNPAVIQALTTPNPPPAQQVLNATIRELLSPTTP